MTCGRVGVLFAPGEYDYEYGDLLMNTIFALVPRGDHGFSYRLLEVRMHVPTS